MARLRPLLTAALLALIGLGSARADEPVVIAVADWGGSAVAPEQLPATPQRIEHITVHHQGERWAMDADPLRYLQRLQQQSRLQRRWVDIPYHYVIAPDGRVFAARPEGLAGDTNTRYDPRGHALLMLLGNFEEQTPTAAQLEAAVALMTALARRHGLDADTIASHRDHSSDTVCPGAALYALLPGLREQVRERLRQAPG